MFSPLVNLNFLGDLLFSLSFLICRLLNSCLPPSARGDLVLDYCSVITSLAVIVSILEERD